MPRPDPETRAAFPHLQVMTTRWRDNDVYGHINNVVYYEYFDSVVNAWLIDQGLLDIAASPEIGLVVETSCSYFAPIAFPDRIAAGLRLERLGQASVTYAVALFRNEEESAAAQGRFTHVYVDRATRRSTPIPERLRAAMATLRAGDPS